MSVTPYSAQDGTKKDQVKTMFNRIAPRYDLLNHLLSFGIDRKWRKRVVKMVKGMKAPVILDVATGTGDLAIALSKTHPSAVYGVDISVGMLEKARQKVQKLGLQHTIILKEGDSEALPFDHHTFDVVTVAFGVRNFGDLNAGLKEMGRVLKPGGKLIVLEFSRPAKFPMKQLFYFYFKRILPLWGGLISNDKEAYAYLPASVMEFPEGEIFESELVNAGLHPEKSIRQTFGIATIYVALKPLQ